ncbi:MAG TPA: porin family protein [Acidobacteriota bacterium]|nr:porin family protein [Acidobacteriota bacterium]
MRKHVTVMVAPFAAVLSLPSSAFAQEQRHEVSVQGAGSFTKDSEGNGISQHTTDSGAFLANYRYHLNRWLAVEGNYGYSRNTYQNFTPTNEFAVNANARQTTGALVLTIPASAIRLEPYVLVGGGVVAFDPRTDVIGTIAGADEETKAAFLYGGGANVRLVPHVALRLEYRGLAYGRPDFGLTQLDSDATAHTALPTLGGSFRF